MKLGEWHNDGLYQNPECTGGQTNPIQPIKCAAKLVSFRCSFSYCRALYTAHQLGISFISGVGLVLCMLIKRDLGHSMFKLQGWGYQWVSMGRYHGSENHLFLPPQFAKPGTFGR